VSAKMSSIDSLAYMRTLIDEIDADWPAVCLHA
jgi:hypothetical protein